MLLADRASSFGHTPDFARIADKLGMCVAHLMARKATTPVFVDQMATRHAIVDDSGTRRIDTAR